MFRSQFERPVAALFEVAGCKLHLFCFLTWLPCNLADGPNPSKCGIAMGAGLGTCTMEEETISGQLRSKNKVLRISQNKWCSWNISGDLADISLCAFRTSIDNFERPHYGRLVIAALAIPQHIATIFVFISVFIRIKEQSLDPRMLIWVVVLAFLIGYIIWEVLSPPQEQRTRA